MSTISLKQVMESVVEHSCYVCGGLLLRVRGRHPGDPRRVVCPTCMLESLEDLMFSRVAFGGCGESQAKR
jgi:hypothetical protein